MSSSVKQQRGFAQSQALCLASSNPAEAHMRQVMAMMMNMGKAAIAQYLEDENTDSPPSRRGPNLQFLKPKAKQTPSPTPAAPEVALTKVAGLSFPALENAVPAEEAGSCDERARKDQEANPSEFAHLRKSALRTPGGSSDAALSPNKVQFDPKTHAMELASAMKEILRLVLYLTCLGLFFLELVLYITCLGLLFWIVCLSPCTDINIASVYTENVFTENRYSPAHFFSISSWQLHISECARIHPGI